MKITVTSLAAAGLGAGLFQLPHGLWSILTDAYGVVLLTSGGVVFAACVIRKLRSRPARKRRSAKPKPIAQKPVAVNRLRRQTRSEADLASRLEAGEIKGEELRELLRSGVARIRR